MSKMIRHYPHMGVIPNIAVVINEKGTISGSSHYCVLNVSYTTLRDV